MKTGKIATLASEPCFPVWILSVPWLDLPQADDPLASTAV